MTDKINYFEFPNCMHIFAGAMHHAYINPDVVEITLPWKEWWELNCLLERKFQGFLPYQGLGETPQSFRYMGFKFSVRTK